MLKNEELKHLIYATTLLAMIREYAIDENTTDFYDKTGITILDIDRCIKNLTHIHSVHTVKHLQASEKANEWNKTHPELHRKHNREYERRKNKMIKGGK